mmetsp:Transcript_114108/g.254612  ORF Transcript_114108/g.254612 Transcript_114108/m.254612 type:complete len:247 (+) Transcript_114108:65-805(+)
MTARAKAAGPQTPGHVGKHRKSHKAKETRTSWKTWKERLSGTKLGQRTGDPENELRAPSPAQLCPPPPYAPQPSPEEGNCGSPSTSWRYFLAELLRIDDFGSETNCTPNERSDKQWSTGSASWLWLSLLGLLRRSGSSPRTAEAEGSGDVKVEKAEDVQEDMESLLAVRFKAPFFALLLFFPSKFKFTRMTVMSSTTSARSAHRFAASKARWFAPFSPLPKAVLTMSAASLTEMKSQTPSLHTRRN